VVLALLQPPPDVYRYFGHPRTAGGTPPPARRMARGSNPKDSEPEGRRVRRPTQEERKGLGGGGDQPPAIHPFMREVWPQSRGTCESTFDRAADSQRIGTGRVSAVRVWRRRGLHPAANGHGQPPGRPTPPLYHTPRGSLRNDQSLAHIPLATRSVCLSIQPPPRISSQGPPPGGRPGVGVRWTTRLATG